MTQESMTSTTPANDVSGHTRSSALMSATELATLLGASTRHIWRMRDGGALPRPIRLGSLVRWRKSDIEKWIADGCPRCR
ncbi:MAG: helix-turn-helix domain-containing protein [Candidatus Hydrogenedentes bacterium]|nr:helix-turn-helix domain-containing protein [Candidatus Hydrogenedentota bacterium]